jgi:frataxin
MDESRFHSLVEETLDDLMERIEAAAGDVLEVDLVAGVLTITLDSGAEYVINKHAPSRELWLSSPASGAGHYAYDEARAAWLETRTGGGLAALLEGELAPLAGRPLGLA